MSTAADYRPAHGGYPPPGHRCFGCGADDPMGCGTLCADCSWEDHLAGMAHTGSPFDALHADTPDCCRESRKRDLARYEAGLL